MEFLTLRNSEEHYQPHSLDSCVVCENVSSDQGGGGDAGDTGSNVVEESSGEDLEGSPGAPKYQDVQDQFLSNGPSDQTTFPETSLYPPGPPLSSEHLSNGFSPSDCLLSPLHDQLCIEERNRKREAQSGPEDGQIKEESPLVQSMSQVLRTLDQLYQDIQEALSCGSSPSSTPCSSRRAQVYSEMSDAPRPVIAAALGQLSRSDSPKHLAPQPPTNTKSSLICM
ncbi:hypothetical protein WMY93_028149 [Mugilogobius chulae]|uniref:Uncharacterized protein n=1 Tax=Mugilogobius chulae TaxID=88201 RepID=A0AAW0MNI9_9GOBI